MKPILLGLSIMMAMSGCQHLTQENLQHGQDIITALTQATDTVKALGVAWEAFQGADGIEEKGVALVRIMALLNELFDTMADINPVEVENAYAVGG